MNSNYTSSNPGPGAVALSLAAPGPKAVFPSGGLLPAAVSSRAGVALTLVRSTLIKV